MKKLLLILICVPLIFNSCKKDDDNQPTGNSGTSVSIVGTWICNSTKHDLILGYIDPVSLSEVVTYTTTIYGPNPDETIEWIFYNNGISKHYLITPDTTEETYTGPYWITGNTLIIMGFDEGLTMTDLTNNTLEINLQGTEYETYGDTTTFIDHDMDLWFNRKN
jgi:hypothetical protein